MNITLDRPAIDYITATSFEPKLLDFAIDTLLPEMVERFDWNEELTEAKLLQYKGLQAHNRVGKQTAFAGKGQQKQKTHFMLRTSSDAADFAYRRMLSLKINYTLTRVDVQLTCEPKVNVTTRLWKRFNEEQFDAEKDRAPRGRKVQLITDNHTGNTVYVGSRASDRFVRVYQKEITERTRTKFEQRSNTSGISGAKLRFRPDSRKKRQPVRLEIELKAQRARACHRQAKRYGLDLTLASVLNDAIQGLVETPLLKPHRLIIDQLQQEDLINEPCDVTTLDATLEWFEKACIAAAIRLLLGRDTQADITDLVIKLISEALPHLDAPTKKQLIDLLAESLENTELRSSLRAPKTESLFKATQFSQGA